MDRQVKLEGGSEGKEEREGEKKDEDVGKGTSRKRESRAVERGG